MIPQFCDARRGRWNNRNFASGFFVFTLGLGKKVLIADAGADFVRTIFDGAGDRAAMGFVAAWAGALAYTFQLYFDFSGYSDMAVGLSRMFNIELPLNFDSPYKAKSIIEFWRRWHMTLSRFLRDYLYIPLGGNRLGEKRRYINLFITMLLGGLWHGAGWTFVIWGAWHGMALIVNQVWRKSPVGSGISAGKARVSRWLSHALTFITVVIGWVLFRSPSLASAGAVLGGMLGRNGPGIPEEWISWLGGLGRWVTVHGAAVRPNANLGAAIPLAWIAVAGLIVFLAPNTQEMAGPVADGPGGNLGDPVEVARWWRWRPTLTWALLHGLLFAVGFAGINKISPFLYYQF